MKNFGNVKKISRKNNNPRDLVTEIDLKLESIIRKTLRSKSPECKIIGEEFAKDKIEKNELVWIIDPIDGTTNYIHGLPFCCISLALWQGNTPIIAFVRSPLLNLSFEATSKTRSLLNNKPIHVSRESKIIQSFGGYGWGRDIKVAGDTFPKMVGKLNKIRSLGSSTLDLCFVAKGTYDFHLQQFLCLWDFAASCLIVKQAGGKTTNLKGKPLNLKSQSVLASNGKIHSELLQILP